MTYNADVKERIITAFKALLNTKELSDITVLEICQKAEITKSTFYRHYRDKFDLSESIFRRLYLSFLQNIRHGRTPRESLQMLFQSLDENRPIFRTLFRFHGQNSALSILASLNCDLLLFLDSNSLNFNIEAGNGHARIGILYDWINSSAPVTDELIDSVLHFLPELFFHPPIIIPILIKSEPEIERFFK